MKKLKNANKTLLSVIARDQAKQIRERIDQGLDVDHWVKVPGLPRPLSLLEYACEKGAAGVARCLVDCGAALNHRTHKPLHHAVLFGHAKIVRNLLENGADPNLAVSDHPNDGGVTPLMTVAAVGKKVVFDLLLQHGADPHAVTRKGATALSRAVSHGNRYAVESLIRRGCRASGQELHSPVYDGDVEMVRLLIRAGADVNVERRREFGLADLSLLDTAIQERGLILVDPISKGDKSAWARAQRRRRSDEKARFLKIIRGLIQAGHRLDRIAVDEAPLYRASKFGDLEVVRLLLRAGADAKKAMRVVPWKKEYRDTALHAAAREGLLEVAEVLTAAGADVEKPDWEGVTPLEAARRQDRSGDVSDAEATTWEQRRDRMISFLERHSRTNDKRGG